MARLDARLTRLTPLVAAEVTRRHERRRRAFTRWQQTLRLAWSDAPALAARFQRDGLPAAAARAEAHHWLETARWFGVVAYEAGAAALGAMLQDIPVTGAAGDRASEGRFTDAEVAALTAWAAATWGEGSSHPHAPWLPPDQRFGALDEAPPRPALIAATAARAHHHPQPWDQAMSGQAGAAALTQGGVFAELVYRYVVHGEDAAAQQAVAQWLAAEVGYDTTTATEQAERLAQDVQAMRQRVMDEGAAAVVPDLIAWGASEAEATLVLAYSGAWPAA
jgi:hypothetical protein